MSYSYSELALIEGQIVFGDDGRRGYIHLLAAGAEYVYVEWDDGEYTIHPINSLQINLS